MQTIFHRKRNNSQRSDSIVTEGSEIFNLKKEIRETAIQILKDKDHMKAQAKILITGKNHGLNCEFCLDNHGKNLRRHLN